MAIYEYECKQCGEKFELRRLMSERDTEAMCPRCKGCSTEHIISMFAGSGGDSECGPIGTSGGG